MIEESRTKKSNFIYLFTITYTLQHNILNVRCYQYQEMNFYEMDQLYLSYIQRLHMFQRTSLLETYLHVHLNDR